MEGTGSAHGAGVAWEWAPLGAAALGRVVTMKDGGLGEETALLPGSQPWVLSSWCQPMKDFQGPLPFVLHTSADLMSTCYVLSSMNVEG